jgi:NAD(P)-dependent dehydrogenase (short-subunit alcohol dehydrogenase family)
MQAATALDRSAHVDEVAAAVRFIAGPNMTGSDITVDGGMKCLTASLIDEEPGDDEQLHTRNGPHTV